jgi:hypothetical protein
LQYQKFNDTYRNFKRFYFILGAWSSVANTSHLNTSLASNIQKMFNEKIEVFSPVEFSKVSILTGVVKIALKTLLECVRLRTFSRY